MKKVFYESWIAEYLLLPSFSTITLFAWIFTKFSKERMKKSTIKHEFAHVRQWSELTISSGVLIWIGMLFFNYSAWWFVLSPFIFYLWYLIEFAIKGIYSFSTKKDYDPYKELSFEREARLAEKDGDYLENSYYFAWFKFIVVKTKNEG